MYVYTEKHSAELVDALTRERLTKYLDRTDGDEESALRLYLWNNALCSAFYNPIQAVEVTLRNAMHRRLTVAYGLAWYDNPEIQLDEESVKRIAYVKEWHGKNKKHSRFDDSDYPNDIVADLSFGFWIGLLNPYYETKLWRPIFRLIFPKGTAIAREPIRRQLGSIRRLRNRIAHHEPIFHRHLEKDYESILNVIEWISPQYYQWTKAHCRLPALLEVNSSIKADVTKVKGAWEAIA